MTTIKSFTDISQSKTLSKILLLDSADMCYLSDESLFPKINYNGMVFFNSEEEKPSTIIPCWSLAALLTTIPYAIRKSDNEFYRLEIDKGYNDYAVWYSNNGLTINDLDVTSDNFVDACVKMILKLHEQKIL